MDPVREQLQQALGEAYRVDRELAGGMNGVAAAGGGRIFRHERPTAAASIGPRTLRASVVRLALLHQALL